MTKALVQALDKARARHHARARWRDVELRGENRRGHGAIVEQTCATGSSPSAGRLAPMEHEAARHPGRRRKPHLAVQDGVAAARCEINTVMKAPTARHSSWVSFLPASG